MTIAAQGAPRGWPCADCGKPIRLGVQPKGHNRKYCDRRRCRRARKARGVRDAYRALGPGEGARRQRELYDPEKRHARAQAMTPAQRTRRRVAQRRYYRAHRVEQNARQRATYDPAARRARYLATGT